MNNGLLRLYLSCFPDYQVTEVIFNTSLNPDAAHIIHLHENDKLIGYSLIHKNSVSILCVDKEFRNRGIGSMLLEQSERYISDAGYDTVILGRGMYYLLQGVPEDSRIISFFEKRNYQAKWTSVNMTLPLIDFNTDNIDIPVCADRINFRFLREDEKSTLLDTVRDAHSGWLHIFERCTDPIFIAEENNRILGFEILTPNGGRFLNSGKAGGIGCVGVIRSAREKGIGRQMVAHGARWLKSRGCESVELLYVALIDWYRKIGFQVEQRQWMGEKSIRSDI